MTNESEISNHGDIPEHSYEEIKQHFSMAKN